MLNIITKGEAARARAHLIALRAHRVDGCLQLSDSAFELATSGARLGERTLLARELLLELGACALHGLELELPLLRLVQHCRVLLLELAHAAERMARVSASLDRCHLESDAAGAVWRREPRARSLHSTRKHELQQTEIN